MVVVLSWYYSLLQSTNLIHIVSNTVVDIGGRVTFRTLTNDFKEFLALY